MNSMKLIMENWRKKTLLNEASHDEYPPYEEFSQKIYNDAVNWAKQLNRILVKRMIEDPSIDKTDLQQILGRVLQYESPDISREDANYLYELWY